MISQDLLLVKILKIIIYILPEIKLPKGPGHPFVYSVKVVMCCFIVMVAKGFFSTRDLHSFLTRKDDGGAQIIRKTIPFPRGKIPSRRTFDRRLSNFQLPVQFYLLAGTRLLVKKIGLGIARLSLDNRMFEASGGTWHRKDQKQGIIPKGLRNIDKLAGWGVSAYRGWVFGHGLDIFVTTGKLTVPVLAIARSLNIRGNTAVKKITHLLFRVKKGIVAADCEYEDQNLAILLKAKGRNLHTASKRNPKDTPKSKTYQKRKTTVEPLYERFLLALSARGKLPFKGKQAWGWLMAGLFLYQLAVIYKVINNQPDPLKVTHLIHAL